MKIIIFDEQFSESKQLEFPKQWLYFAAAFIAVLLVALVTFVALSVSRGYKIDEYKVQVANISEQLLFDRHELESFNVFARQVFAEHAKQAASVQARIARLEALGGQVADMAGLNDEFDFYSEPALGGPNSGSALDVKGGSTSEQEGKPQAKLPEPDQKSVQESSDVASSTEIDASEEEATIAQQSPALNDQQNVLQSLHYLSHKAAVREGQLKAIESLLLNKQLVKERYLAGKPIKKGWLSSYYGYRTDPFTGKRTWHKGVDFAGKEDSEVIAVGSGVVTWSGKRYGYGLMVEVTHGNGYATRYAHNKINLVKMGEVVKKGQTIAKMGSTGRSTGPHVHFEVYRHGKAVDPVRYIYRKSR